ncbi:hypothetical protein WN51_04893 [Melipona quadrifasciata]|uniref:Uncharacterized protein n=1 Tax=Melipona quadrifasciata TaxID=166423 RepID=A0A0M8ZUZ5_9HYME|nr:hypothetical protein WN51_04893 [Melipona quadrifasciata]
MGNLSKELLEESVDRAVSVSREFTFHNTQTQMQNTVQRIERNIISLKILPTKTTVPRRITAPKTTPRKFLTHRAHLQTPCLPSAPFFLLRFTLPEECD